MISEKMIALGTQRSVIRELFEFGKQRAKEIGAENVFDFSIGNPSVPAPDAVNQTAMNLLLHEDPVILHGYTSAQGDYEVRTKISESINRRFTTNLGPDNLYITVGAAASLSCCFKALTCPKDEFIVFAPYFPEYQVFIENAGAKMVLIPADTKAFQINFEAFEQAITSHTKGVIVNSPNNPSGCVYSEETIKQLASILEKKSKEYGEPIYLISDEPYREVAYDNIVIPYLTKYYKNTLVCYSYSKSLSLPGERLGYVVVPSEMDNWQTVYAAIAGAGRSLGYVNAPSLFQRVCASCCNLTSDISIYQTNRNILTESLKDLGYSVVKPAGTFYLFPQTLIPDDIAFCEKAKDYNLLVVPGSGFGCSGHMRISFCVPTERVKRSLDAFEQLAKYFQ